MRIVATSDVHGKLLDSMLPEGDVLCLAGDILQNYIDDKKEGTWQLFELEKQVARFERLPYSKILFVAGNHDWVFERRPVAARRLFTNKVVYLQDESYVFEGKTFYGSPWQPVFYDWAFNLPRDGEELNNKWSMIPDKLDVLITHGPPFGILDQPHGSGEHVGDALLLFAIGNKQPRHHLFGHIHGSYGMYRFADTICHNVALCNERYQPVNPPQVFDI